MEHPVSLVIGACGFSGSHEVSNNKIKSKNFETFLYLDTMAGIEETIAWYREQGWIRGSAISNESD